MKKKQILSLVLCFAIIFPVFLQNIVYAETGNSPDATDKGMRQVYLHAFDETPSVNTSENRHTVYMGEDTNIFLAVDNPNKGRYLDSDDPIVEEARQAALLKATEEAENNPALTTQEAKQNYIDYEVSKAVQLERHSEPQYDMQGYTVKIYFDTKYFKFKDTRNPINFKEPNESNGGDIVDGEDIKGENDSALNPGYMTHMPSYNDSEGYASATVFLMGSGFFPTRPMIYGIISAV